MIESAVQVSDSLRSSKERHRTPPRNYSTHSQEVQVNFLTEEEMKIKVDQPEQPPQVTLIDLSDKVTNLAE